MTDNTTETPLIWTTKGNLPENELRFEHSWLDNEDFTSLTLTYYLGEEIVKSSTHVYNRQTIDLSGSTSDF